MKASPIHKPVIASLVLAFIGTASPLPAHPQHSDAAPASPPEPVAQREGEAPATDSLYARLVGAGLLSAKGAGSSQFDSKVTWAEFSAIITEMTGEAGIVPPNGAAKSAEEYLSNASLSDYLSDASQRSLIAKAIERIKRNPEQAAMLAGIYAAFLKPGMVNKLAEEIGKLFAQNNAILSAAPAIARAITIAIEGKQGYSLDTRARAIGESVSTLIYHMDPLKPERRQLVLDTAVNAVSFRPKSNYTETIVEIILRTARAMGFPDEYMTALIDAMRSAVEDGSLITAGASSALQQQGIEVTDHFQGEVIVQETPVINR